MPLRRAIAKAMHARRGGELSNEPLKLTTASRSQLSAMVLDVRGQEKLMLRYHHLGIPTSEPRSDERYLPEFGMHVSGYEASPFRIEWMRFEDDSPLPELVQQVPHVAFEVDDLEAALEGRDVLIPPNSPSPGVLVAFVIANGAPVELMQIDSEVVASTDV